MIMKQQIIKLLKQNKKYKNRIKNIIYKKYKDFKIKDKNDYNKYCFPKKFNLQN